MPTDVLEREISPELEGQLREHAGRWVAATRDKIVAVGDLPQDVYTKARKQGIDVPIILRVPEAGQSYFF